MDTAPPFALYNPALLPPDVLLSEFTARRPLLARLLDIIRANDPGEPPQHVLCVGPRGMGKTTLLCAIAATIKLHEPELAQHWQPVIFDEESRRIGDLADFWLECIRQWESETEPHLTRSHRIDALLANPGPDIEDKARDVFLALVDASGKRALLLIDNLNDIFIAVNDAESLMRLRSFLMSDPRVMIIGAATRWFSDVTGLDKPFFEFFRPFDLHALSLEEMRECLAGVAKARGDQRVLDTLRDRPGSIEVLHILTGGNPRLIRTFYRLLNEGMNGELRLQLERLIDDYTPYHKAIIDALPGQQQRVLDAIALEWNPTDVATVARTTRLPSNQVSAQIKALIKAGLISEAANMGHSKKKAYLLTDRFSNIHYLMRHGRTGKLKMHWFVMMLRALFADKEFAEFAAKSVRLTADGGLGNERDSLLLAQNVIDHAGSEMARREFLDRVAGSPEFDGDVDVKLAEKVCRHAIDANPSDAYCHFKLGRLLDFHLKRYPEAEEAYRRAIELDPNDSLPWFNLSILLTGKFGRHTEAEEAYRKSIALNPELALPWNQNGTLLSDRFGRRAASAASCHKNVWPVPKDAPLWCLLAESDAGGAVQFREKLHRTRLAEDAKRRTLMQERMEFESDMEELAAIRAHQTEVLRLLGDLKKRQKSSDLERGLGRRDNEADNEIRRARAFSCLRPEIVAGIVPPERAAMMVRYAEAMRPQPTVHVASPNAGAPPSAATGEFFETFAQRYLPCVGVVVVETDLGAEKKMLPIATVWVARGMACVVTTAHVAMAVAEAWRVGARAWVLFSGGSAPISVRSASVHRNYDSKFNASRPFPSWDVGTLDLDGTLPGPGLPIADVASLNSLRQLSPVAYLGFQMEGLAGGDANLQGPRAVAKRGVLCSLQDTGMRDTQDPALRMILVNDIGLMGGASGGPLFDSTGSVIGIISATNMQIERNTETGILRRYPNAAQLSFAQRIDMLTENPESMKTICQDFRLSAGYSTKLADLRNLCFSQPDSLRSVLPEVIHWCTQHPDDQSVLSFMVDAWIAYAKATSASEARELLDAQPDEVKLAFETVRDAFLAHDDKDHLHRLAPERRAPVLKLLERLRP